MSPNLTIVTHTEPCWYLAEPSGAEVGYDSPHFATADVACDYAADRHPGKKLRPERYAKPCREVLCCGQSLSNGQFDGLHFGAEEDVEGWLADPDDTATEIVCPRCGQPITTVAQVTS